MYHLRESIVLTEPSGTLTTTTVIKEGSPALAVGHAITFPSGAQAGPLFKSRMTPKGFEPGLFASSRSSSPSAVARNKAGPPSIFRIKARRVPSGDGLPGELTFETIFREAPPSVAPRNRFHPAPSCLR